MRNVTQKKRVYMVEFWRFFFCLAVVGLHLFSELKMPYFTAGYLGVEFFFILSGYGIASFYLSKMQEQKITERVSQLGVYIGKRLRRLYPLYFLALLVMLAIKSVLAHWSVADVWEYLKAGWAEFLMMQCGPMGGEVLVFTDWYVAAVFWGGLLLLLLLLVTGNVGGFLLCPLISFGIYTYYFRLIRKIDVIVSYHAILRGIAGIALGIFLGFVVHFLLQKGAGDLKKVHPLVQKGLFWGANGLLAGLFVYTNYGRRSGADFVVIGLYTIALFLLMITKVELPERVEAFFKKMGQITYPIYLFQIPIITCIVSLL